MLLVIAMASFVAVEPDPVTCRLPDGETVQCVWEYRTGAQPMLVLRKPELVFRSGFES